MIRSLITLCFALLLGGSVLAADNSTLPVCSACAASEVFANKDIGGVKFPKHIIYNSSGTEVGTVTDPFYVSGVGASPGDAPSTFSPIGARQSGATGGLDQPIRTCDTFAKYDASDTGSITLVTGVASRKIYICRVIMSTSGTETTLKLREGSDANCATAGADITPGIALLANDKIGFGGQIWDGLVTSTNGYYVCINASAANAHQAMIWYTIQ
jgi:hypothetical protein